MVNVRTHIISWNNIFSRSVCVCVIQCYIRHTRAFVDGWKRAASCARLLAHVNACKSGEHKFKNCHCHHPFSAIIRKLFVGPSR